LNRVMGRHLYCNVLLRHVNSDMVWRHVNCLVVWRHVIGSHGFHVWSWRNCKGDMSYFNVTILSPESIIKLLRSWLFVWVPEYCGIMQGGGRVAFINWSGRVSMIRDRCGTVWTYMYGMWSIWDMVRSRTGWDMVGGRAGWDVVGGRAGWDVVWGRAGWDVIRGRAGLVAG